MHRQYILFQPFVEVGLEFQALESGVGLQDRLPFVKPLLPDAVPLWRNLRLLHLLVLTEEAVHEFHPGGNG